LAPVTRDPDDRPLTRCEERRQPRQANTEAFKTVSARLAKSLDEIKALAQRLAKEQRESAS
jgi:hypothetical protein